MTYVDHYPFLGVLPEEAGETADINALYAARFGVPPAGKRVFIRTVQRDLNGCPPADLQRPRPPGVAPRHVRKSRGEDARSDYRQSSGLFIPLRRSTCV